MFESTLRVGFGKKDMNLITNIRQTILEPGAFHTVDAFLSGGFSHYRLFEKLRIVISEIMTSKKGVKTGVFTRSKLY